MCTIKKQSPPKSKQASRYAGPSMYLVNAEEDTLGGELEQGADELGRHVHLHDELLATLATQDGMAQQSLGHKLGTAATPQRMPHQH